MDIRGFGLDDDDLAALGYKVRRGSGREPGTDPGRPASGPIDPSWRMWAVTVLFLVATAWGASAQRWLPNPAPGNHPDTAFSSARALSQLSEIARLPRPMGSPEHARVREHLVQRLRALGLEPEIQTVTQAVRDGDLVRAATVRNVVARLPGVASTGAVALTAHYDGAALSPGAGDGGVGLATVLEAVRAVVNGPPLRNDLVVVLADGHEPGLLGARAFVERHPWMQDVALVASVEMWGVSGPSLLLATGPRNGRLVQAMGEWDTAPAAVPFVTDLLRSRAPDADVVPFGERGARTLSLTAMGGRALNGRPADRPERVREATLQHHGLHLLAVARTFGQRDLTDRSRLDGPERAYFTAPLAGFVHYPASRTLLMSLALVALWAVAALALRSRGGGTWRGVLAGLLMAAAAVGAAAALAHGVFDVVRDMHPEYGTLGSALYREGLHLVALLCLAAATVTAGFALARRRFGAGELFLGALVVPLLVVIWLCIGDPSAAAALQWALAPALLSGVLLAASGRGRRPGLWEWMVYALLAVGTLSLLVPTIQVMAGTLTLRSAPLLAALAATVMLLVLPVMEWLQRPRGWWAPALTSAAAAALVTIGSPAVRGGAGHPMPTSLIYLVDQPAAGIDQPPVGGVLRMTAATRASERPATRRLLGHWLTVPGPGEEWSRSWVAEPAAGAIAPGVLLMPGGERYEVAGTGPASDVAPARVHVIRSVVEGAWRTLELSVEPGLGGEMLGLHVGEDAGAAIRGVGGAVWNDADPSPVLGLMHWGTPEGGTVPVLLRVEADRQHVTLNVVEHHLRPVDVLGDLFFQRADSVAPDASTGSDRVIQRTRVTLPLAATLPGAAGAG
jgi:hypothetical protein